MRQSHHQIKFPCPSNLFALRNNAKHISPSTKSPQKLIPPPSKLPRSTSPNSYINPNKSPPNYPQTSKLVGSPPKYPTHIPQSSTRKDIKQLVKKQSWSQQTTQSSRTMSQLDIPKEERKNMGYDLSAIGSDTSDLPTTIKQQPNFMLFLCTNCYQYFLLPQRAIHASTCTFEATEHEINIKINKIIEITKMIDGKYPHRFLKAIASKLEEYQKRSINMEDILLFQMLIVKGEPHPDLNWKELFWVIKELMRLKERIRMERMSKGWKFCL